MFSVPRHRAPRDARRTPRRGRLRDTARVLLAAGAGRPGFTSAEAGLVLRAGRHLADGYRRALLLASPPGAAGQGAGLVLFDPHGVPESVDPVAAGYFDGGDAEHLLHPAP